MNSACPPASRFSRFESLGDNCELGFAQRALGDAGSSLLRWSIAQPDAVCRALESDFENFYLFENLIPSADDMVCDTASGLFFHTAMRSSERVFIQPEDARRVAYEAEKAKMDHLLGRFRAVLADPQTIFVYKTNAGVGDDRGRRLLRAIGQHGGSRLLIVRLANAECPPGRVVYLGDGLFAGYIDAFAPYTKADDVSLACWQVILDGVLQRIAMDERMETLKRNFNGIAEVDYSVHIDPDLRFIYFNNPKCACSTVKASLNMSYAAYAGLELSYGAIGEIHDRRKNFLRTPRQVGLETFLRMLDDSQVFKFCFVREPQARICSAYESQLRWNSPPLRNLAMRVGKSEEWRPTFEEFVSAIINDPPTRDSDEHWRLQVKQICLYQIDYSFIGTFDRLEQDLARILEKFFGAAASFYDVRLHFTGNRSESARRLAQSPPALLEALARSYDADAAMYRMASRVRPAMIDDLSRPEL